MRDWSEVGYVIDTSIWLSPKEWAKLKGCALHTLYNKKSAGKLPENWMLTDGHYWYLHIDCPLSDVIRVTK